MRKILWLVEMENNVDRQDDEVWKVRAATEDDAREEVRGRNNRFTIGRIVPARGGTYTQKLTAKLFRTYCTRTI